MSKNSILSQMPIDLGDDLNLRFATPADTDTLTEFNARLHEAENIGVTVRDLMSKDHPTCKASDSPSLKIPRLEKLCRPPV